MVALDLISFGKCGAENEWFSCRLQTFEVNGVKSDFRPIRAGVPEGALSLGLLLFMIYVNGLQSCLGILKLK